MPSRWRGAASAARRRAPRAALPAAVRRCGAPSAIVRLGLGFVLGVREEEVKALVAAREEGGPFRSLADLASRAGAGRPSLDRLAWAGACDSLIGGSSEHARRTALWQLGVAAPGERMLEGTQLALPLEVPDAPDAAAAHAVGVDDRRLRDDRAHARAAPDEAAAAVAAAGHGVDRATSRGCRTTRRCELGGLVVARQRPGTAKGIVFLLLEDEFGTINLIVPPDLYEANRLTVRSEPLLLCEGRLEKLPQAGGGINVFVKAVRSLVTPEEQTAEVVALAERRVAGGGDGPRRGRAGRARGGVDDGRVPAGLAADPELRVADGGR